MSQPPERSLMQRFIRGRILYLLLGLLVVVLHVRALSFHQPDSLEHGPDPAGAVQDAGPGVSLPSDGDLVVKQPKHIEDTLVWLPKQLDQAALQRLIGQEPQLVLRLVLIGAIIAMMLIVGGVWSLRGLADQPLRTLWRFSAPHLPAWSLGELWRIIGLVVLVVALLPFVQLSIAAYYMTWKPDRNFWISASMLVLDALLILVVLAFARGKGRSPGEAFGLVRRRASASIRESLRGYVTAFPWLVLILIITVEIVRLTGWVPPEEPIAQLIFQEGRPAVLALTMVLACVIGPIAEELLFRGVLYSAVRKRTSWVVAMLVSGALFALIHTNPLGFVPIMGLGCLLAYLYERTGSLAGPLTVHITHNTLLMSLAMTVRQLMSHLGPTAGQ